MSILTTLARAKRHDVDRFSLAKNAFPELEGRFCFDQWDEKQPVTWSVADGMMFTHNPIRTPMLIRLFLGWFPVAAASLAAANAPIAVVDPLALPARS